jgi:RimJ/RimL family protein N-acetyltransferase
MMVGLIQAIRYRLPVLWKFIDCLNAFMVNRFFGQRLLDFVTSIESFSEINHIRFRSANQGDEAYVLSFLHSLDEDDIRYFQPFEFTLERISQVIQGRGFRLFIAEDANGMSGLFFVRLFFDGRAFLGFIVAKWARGQGLGTAMVRSLAKAVHVSGLRLYSTVSTKNLASIYAHKKAARFTEIEKLPGDYVVLLLRKGT